MIQSYDLYMPVHLVFEKGRVAELPKLIKGYGKKVLLTYGGGSTLDCSKAIALGAKYDGDPWDLVIHRDRVKGHLPVFDVLTLAATGSDYDGGGVITNDATNEKRAVGVCFPVASILDPEYTFTVPASQTAAGSADIISHTFEQYFVSEGSMLSDGFCESMLRTVMKYAPVAIKDPTNFEARGELLAASSFGCCRLLAVGREAGAWPCHGIEHELSAWYDITHGVGLAIITPAWMRYCLKNNPAVVAPKFAQYGVNVLGLNPADGVETNAKKSIEKTAEFFRSIGITQTLKDFGIDETHFDEMADHAMTTWFAGRPPYTFAPLGREGILEILKASL